jgi:hypothetical protein
MMFIDAYQVSEKGFLIDCVFKFHFKLVCVSWKNITTVKIKNGTVVRAVYATGELEPVY